MPYKLKTRNRPIPNGLTAYDAATNTLPDQHTDFEFQCLQWQLARIGNPGLCRRYRVSTDLETIRGEVDEQLAKKCHDHGWTDFIIEVKGGGSPGHVPPFQQGHKGVLAKALAVVGAAPPLIDWVASKEDAVPQAKAAKRASKCADMRNGKPCPMNQAGDWTKFFTVPAAAIVKKALEMRLEMKLSTPFDEHLHVCMACECPLKLKVHMKTKKILDNMPQEDFDALDEGCWLREEKSAPSK